MHHFTLINLLNEIVVHFLFCVKLNQKFKFWFTYYAFAYRLKLSWIFICPYCDADYNFPFLLVFCFCFDLPKSENQDYGIRLKRCEANVLWIMRNERRINECLIWTKSEVVNGIVLNHLRPLYDLYWALSANSEHPFRLYPFILHRTNAHI